MIPDSVTIEYEQSISKSIRDLAFEMEPPNRFTPQFVMLANAVENLEHAYKKLTQCNHVIDAHLNERGQYVPKCKKCGWTP